MGYSFNASRPTDILLARNRVVPFQDFGARLAALIEWAKLAPGSGAERSVGGRLYVGDGGVGKTRLALALADALKQEGWAAPEVRREYDLLGIWRAVESAPNTAPPGILVIVDYTEARPQVLAQLAEAALDLQSKPGSSLRILALARSAGAWWSAVRVERGMEIFASEAFRMGTADAPLNSSERGKLYSTALAAFRDVLLNDLAGPMTAPPDLSSDALDRPLSIAIAAYLSARGIASEDGSRLFDDLLFEERRHWKGVLGIKDESAADKRAIEALRRGSAQITLVQGASEDEAYATLMADSFFDRNAPSACAAEVEALRRLYPGNGVDNNAIGPIEPDVLGEAAIARIVRDGPKGIGLIQATLSQVLRGGDGERASDALKRAVEVILRMANHPEAGTRHITRKIIIPSLEGWCPQLPPADAAKLTAAVPWETVEMRTLAAVAAQRALDDYLDDDTSESTQQRRANALNNYAKRLSDLERRQEALTASQEAVAIFRKLVARNRDAFLDDLARNLDNMALHLAAADRSEESAWASDEAIDIYTHLVEKNRSDARLSALASALTNSIIGLLARDRQQDALRAGEKAVVIRRELAAKSADDLDWLAGSLNNLATVLLRIGCLEKALQMTEEAVSIRMKLVAKNRDAFLHTLPGNLGTMSNCLFKLGQKQEALRVIEEAIAIQKELIGMNRDAFLRDYAVHLMNRGILLSELGQLEEALRSSETGVSVYRELVGKNVGFYHFHGELASALGNLAERLTKLGRAEEAMRARQESLVTYFDGSFRTPLARKPRKTWKRKASKKGRNKKLT